MIFETMVLGGELDETVKRYATEAEALSGHQMMCLVVQALETLPDR